MQSVHTTEVFWRIPLNSETQFSFTLVLQLDWTPNTSRQKIICQRTRRATTIPTPRLESSRQGEFRSAGFRVVSSSFASFSKSLSKWRPNKMEPGRFGFASLNTLVPRSQVFSEVPQINCKLIFHLVKEVKLICVRSIISCSRVPVIC